MVSLPLKLPSSKSAHTTVLTVLRRFEFEPQLLRSGVIVTDSAGSSEEMVFFVRGAPTSIEELIPHAAMPHQTRQVCLVGPGNVHPDAFTLPPEAVCSVVAADTMSYSHRDVN